MVDKSDGEEICKQQFMEEVSKIGLPDFESI